MNIASIDIGTNTVLLLIAKVNLSDKSLTTLLNEYEMPRIGKGLKPGFPITEDRIGALFNILSRYNKIIKEHKCEHVFVNATNAFRIASNSQEIKNKIKDQFAFETNIIDGSTEAKYSYLGAISTVKSNYYIVIDIGGGSTEIVYGSTDEILYGESFHIGAVSLTEEFIKNDPPTDYEIELCNYKIVEVFQKLNEKSFEKFSGIAVAGTPTSLASIKLGLKEYDENKLSNALILMNEIKDITFNYLMKKRKTEVLNEYPKIVRGREDILPAGSLILLNLMEILKFDKLIVSTRGIRYGAVVEFMNNKY